MTPNQIKKVAAIIEPLQQELWGINYSIRLQNSVLDDTASQLAALSEKLIEAADQIDFMARNEPDPEDNGPGDDPAERESCEQCIDPAGCHERHRGWKCAFCGNNGQDNVSLNKFCAYCNRHR